MTKRTVGKPSKQTTQNILAEVLPGAQIIRRTDPRTHRRMWFVMVGKETVDKFASLQGILNWVEQKVTTT